METSLTNVASPPGGFPANAPGGEEPGTYAVQAILDSGACDHVAARDEFPGYEFDTPLPVAGKPNEAETVRHTSR